LGQLVDEERQMPFARFTRMPEEKRERLLTTAAQEFATYGYEGASLNHILDVAHIGKSSAYYYFADKADLFATVAAWCVERLRLAISVDVIAGLSADTFWATIAAAHGESLRLARQQPWLFGAARAVERLTPESLEQESLRDLATRLMTGMRAVIDQGQALGLIRTDLPADLLQAWFRAIDGASDDWLLAHLDQQDDETCRVVAEQTMGAIQQTLAAPHQPP
jgi:AcrR family transcriptional regulator